MGRKRSLQPQHQLSKTKTSIQLSSIQLLHLDMDEAQDDCSDIGDLSVSSHTSGLGLDTSRNNDHGIAGIDDLYHQDSESHTPSDCSHSTAHSSGSVKVKQIAHRETKKVTRWKTFVMTLLLINAGLVTISTFEFMRRQEEEEFQDAVCPDPDS